MFVMPNSSENNKFPKNRNWENLKDEIFSAIVENETRKKMHLGMKY